MNKQQRAEIRRNIADYDRRITQGKAKGYHTRGLVIARNRNARLLAEAAQS